MIYRVEDLHRLFHGVAVELPGRGYVPARPLRPSFFGLRLRAAWAVLTDRADAVIWPEDEPREDAPPPAPPRNQEPKP